MMSSTLNSRKRNSRLGLEVSQRLASIFVQMPWLVTRYAKDMAAGDGVLV
ncbi:hypothetical protein [Coleofasciculus sp. G2-EDA-02]